MKVGLSFSRCVRDIAAGIVPMHDVLVVISRTDCDPRKADHWDELWAGYSWGEWSEFSDADQDRVRSVAIELMETGRLHQPRQFGQFPVRPPGHYWLETVLPHEALEQNPAVAEAWNQFKFLAGLTGIDVKGNNHEQS